MAELALPGPTRALRERVGVARTIGAVVSSSNEVERPGVVRNSSPERNQLTIGEIDDSASGRIAELRAVLVAAGIASPPTLDIREAVWTKLINNLRASLLSLLTDRTSREVSTIRPCARSSTRSGRRRSRSRRRAGSTGRSIRDRPRRVTCPPCPRTTAAGDRWRRMRCSICRSPLLAQPAWRHRP
nr:hypothetical protein [Sphingomonas guangdongensis]